MVDDAERRRALERIVIRDELQSHGDDEDTGIIEQEAARRVDGAEPSSPAPSSSVPPRAKWMVYVLNTLPPWGRVAVLVVVVGVLGALAAKLGPAAIGQWFK